MCRVVGGEFLFIGALHIQRGDNIYTAGKIESSRKSYNYNILQKGQHITNHGTREES